MHKIAVILFNLGGPDSKESIQPFLMNFFLDKNIINLPLPLRWLIAKKISNKRSKNEAKIAYSYLKYKSPLLDNSQKQADALEKILNKQNTEENYKVFLSMRYWHPMAKETIIKLKEYQPDKIVLLPLYPQYSTTTTYSSFQNFLKEIQLSEKKFFKEWQNKIYYICCYPINEGFIEASAQNIASKYKLALKNNHNNLRILFSAHGLPEKIIKNGDPYQWQCEQTSAAIIKRLAIKLNINQNELDWQNCYQSRIGPLKWIGPSTEETIQKAAYEKKNIIIYPHAFIQEHVETLVELDIEYKHKVENWGILGYYRAETAGIHSAFISGLANIVKNKLTQSKLYLDNTQCYCADNFKNCHNSNKKI